MDYSLQLRPMNFPGQRWSTLVNAGRSAAVIWLRPKVQIMLREGDRDSLRLKLFEYGNTQFGCDRVNIPNIRDERAQYKTEGAS